MARSEDRQALMRIATVLGALADLAERASLRPFPVLCLVLCLLRPAEAIARHCVVAAMRAAALPAPVLALNPGDATDARAEALLLAAAFRLLAAVLGALALAGTPAYGQPSSPRYEAQCLLAGMRSELAPAAADTS